MHSFAATTDGVAVRDRLDYWREAVRQHVVDLDFEAPHGAEFQASVAGTRLADIAISRIKASAHLARHDVRPCSARPQERLILNFVLSGHMLVRQDGRDIVLGPGDGALCQAAQPYALSFDQPFEVACVTLDRDAILSRAANVGRLTARSLAQSSELCGIAFAFVCGLIAKELPFKQANTDKVARSFQELLGAMLNEALPGAPLPLSEYRLSALLRVKDYIERHLCDAALDTAAVAAALKLSPRYINQLLEVEGTSLSRYIWKRRVERAAADLRNPALKSSTISVIAMANGFNDLAHFSKAFRQRFDTSARDFRGGMAAGA